MKRINKLLIVFTFCLCLALFGCSNNNPTEPVDTETPKENQYMLAEEEACFNFFWEQQKTNPASKGCGLIPDRYPSNGLASIASVGFGLASFIVGVENKWITREEGYARALLTLDHIRDLDRFHGFYYHFYYDTTGTIANNTEVSSIDTALFVAGALSAGEYFKGEVENLANEIYEAVEWDYFVNPKTNNFRMSYKNGKFESQDWDSYAEQLIMYFLAAGSPTHPVGKKVYDAFKRRKGSFESEVFINSWYGSIFTYQYSHAFIDFRNMLDPNGVDWFENSVQATIANYNYCQYLAKTFDKTLSTKAWGLTACDVKGGYSGKHGAKPRNASDAVDDGTVAPCGAIGSICFTPDLVMPVFKHYATLLDGALIGDYGFKDSFNFEDGIWIAGSVIGIDKGISILMIENYRSGIIWKTFMKLPLMERAIQVLEFTKK